jgi:hypothetical protein
MRTLSLAWFESARFESAWFKAAWFKAAWFKAAFKSAGFKPTSLKSIGLRSVALKMILALCLPAAMPALAQQTSSPATQDEINKQLLDRIQELEKEEQRLKAQQANAVPPAPAVEAPTVNEVAPRLKMVVFGDVGAEGYNHSPDTFLFGSLDLFMTARLSDKASALGEVLFIAQSDNTIQADVERLLFRWRQNDSLIASIGRYHSWVGYYNTAFNYGAFLETTTDRPFIYAFDDSGGVLPMQEVGVNLTGKIPSGKMGLNYVLEVGNGRAWGPGQQPAQNNQDGNNSKSINGGLFVRPEKISGLQLGFSLRHDNLTVPGPSVGETIATVHAVYINSKYEILNEGVLVRHVEPSGPVFGTTSYYTQWSRAFGNWRPYFRYQYFNAHDDDPVYIYASPSNYAPPTATAFVGRLNGPSVGVRYDFTEHSALKLQYNRIALRGFATQNGVSTEIAFTF